MTTSIRSQCRATNTECCSDVDITTSELQRFSNIASTLDSTFNSQWTINVVLTTLLQLWNRDGHFKLALNGQFCSSFSEIWHALPVASWTSVIIKLFLFWVAQFMMTLSKSSKIAAKWPFWHKQLLLSGFTSQKDKLFMDWKPVKNYLPGSEWVSKHGSLYLHPWTCPKFWKRFQKSDFNNVKERVCFFCFPKELAQNQLDIRNLNEIVDAAKLHQNLPLCHFQGVNFTWKMLKITKENNV